MLDCKLSQDTFQAIISVIIYFACFVCLFIAGVPMRRNDAASSSIAKFVSLPKNTLIGWASC